MIPVETHFRETIFLIKVLRLGPLIQSPHILVDSRELTLSLIIWVKYQFILVASRVPIGNLSRTQVLSILVDFSREVLSAFVSLVGLSFQLLLTLLRYHFMNAALSYPKWRLSDPHTKVRGSTWATLIS